jgi:hypothetical protein
MLVSYMPESVLLQNPEYRVISKLLLGFPWPINGNANNNLESHLGLTDDPTCERCLQEDESATHTLCDCEAIPYSRFSHLGQFFKELSDFYDAPIIKVLHVIRNVGLIKG